MDVQDWLACIYLRDGYWEQDPAGEEDVLYWAMTNEANEGAVEYAATQWSWERA